MVVFIIVSAAAASVLSAWIPAAIEGWRAVKSTPLPVMCDAVPPGRSDRVLLLSWTGLAQQRWRTHARPLAPMSGPPSLNEVDEPGPYVASKVVAWPRHLPVPEEKPGFEICSDAAGWPWMCLQRVTTFQEVSPGMVQIDFGPGREVWMVEINKKWYMMPLRPIWPGLLGNAAVFAGGFAVVLLGPGLVRRAARRIGGRCQTCGYSLVGTTGETCPECGAMAAAGGVAR